MTSHSRSQRRFRQHLRGLVVAAIFSVAAITVAYNHADHSSPSRQAVGSFAVDSSSHGGYLAPNGIFTTVAGQRATISSLRGRSTMVWFIAAGCASCAASIPAVAAHYRHLHTDGVRVVTLGLWGAFPQGRTGLAQLAGFARSAGGIFNSPGWEWGNASRALSEAYDPTGTPDVYVLIDARGRVVYRNSVPVSTMSQLLSAAAHLN